MGFTLLGILNAQAVGAQVPEPAFLDSAPLWLDAADASTITASSGSVSQWNNKGTLENLTQATSAEQPTTGVSTQNGLNVIDFNADTLSGATASAWKFLHDGTDYFIASVVKFGTVANPDVNFNFMDTNSNSTGNVGFTFAFRDSSSLSPPRNNGLLFVVSNGGARAVGWEQQNILTPNTFVTTSVLADPNDATAANRADVFVNNVQQSFENTETSAVSASNPNRAVRLGNNLVGSIGELIIVSGADATESNRQEVVEYLNAKWSVFS